MVVQGGQVPEFQVQPDPAKLVQAGVTIPNILDAIGRSNMIDSPGLIETNHQLVLSLVSGQARDAGEIANIVVKTTPAGAPVRIGDVATVSPSVMPVYTVVTANGKPAVLLNIYRQPDSNTVMVANAVHAEIDDICRRTCRKGVELRPFYDQSEIVNESIKSVRDAILLGLDPGVADHGAVPARLGHVAGGRAGDSRHHRGHVHRPARAGPELQPDDAGRPGRGRGPGDRRRHRGGGEHRHAPRLRPVARRSHPQRHPRNPRAAGGLHHHARSWSSCR